MPLPNKPPNAHPSPCGPCPLVFCLRFSSLPNAWLEWWLSHILKGDCLRSDSRRRASRPSELAVAIVVPLQAPLSTSHSRAPKNAHLAILHLDTQSTPQMCVDYVSRQVWSLEMQWIVRKCVPLATPLARLRFPSSLASFCSSHPMSCRALLTLLSSALIHPCAA